MFREARIAGQRRYWLGDDVWNQLLTHWNSPTYRNKCVTAQRNRASPRVRAYTQAIPLLLMSMPFVW